MDKGALGFKPAKLRFCRVGAKKALYGDRAQMTQHELTRGRLEAPPIIFFKLSHGFSF